MAHDRVSVHSFAPTWGSTFEAFFDQADATDAEEDRLYGVGQQQHDLPAEQQRREARHAKIRAVRESLPQETAKRRADELQHMADELQAKAEDPTTPAAQQAGFTTMAAQHDQQAAELDDDDPPPPSADSDPPRNTPPAKPDGTPQPKAQRNFTDPESRIMLSSSSGGRSEAAASPLWQGPRLPDAPTWGPQVPDHRAARSRWILRATHS